MAVTELSLDAAWSVLATDPQAVLIDVRTEAEWNFVGMPDLSAIGKQARLVEWVSYPAGVTNPNFVAQATDGLATDQPVLLLCRSGARSAAATEVLLASGFEGAVNVVAGFEGDVDADGHRHGGWKDSLPWLQR